MDTDITQGVSTEQARYVLTALSTAGVAHLTYNEGPPPRPAHTLHEAPTRNPKLRRIVIAALPGTEEIMLAMEGSGCTIISRGQNTNEFTLVSAGFFLLAARRLAELLHALAKTGGAVEDEAALRYPQLAHHTD